MSQLEILIAVVAALEASGNPQAVLEAVAAHFGYTTIEKGSR